MGHDIADSAIRTAASETEVTVDELNELLDDFQDGLEDKFYDWMKFHFVPGGSEEYLVEGIKDGYWFGLDLTEFKPLFDADVTSEERVAVAMAHETEFHEQGMAMEIPQSWANHRDLDQYVPVMIASTDGFERGLQASVFHLMRLVSYDMTPAEALDYYVIEDLDWKKEEWIGYRGVGREAINKNLRSARDKLDQDELENHEKLIHPAKNIRAVPKDEVEEEEHRIRIRPREEYDDRV